MKICCENIKNNTKLYGFDNTALVQKVNFKNKTCQICPKCLQLLAMRWVGGKIEELEPMQCQARTQFPWHNAAKQSFMGGGETLYIASGSFQNYFMCVGQCLY